MRVPHNKRKTIFLSIRYRFKMIVHYNHDNFILLARDNPHVPSRHTPLGHGRLGTRLPTMYNYINT